MPPLNSCHHQFLRTAGLEGHPGRINTGVISGINAAIGSSSPECWIHVRYSLDPDTWKLGNSWSHDTLRLSSSETEMSGSMFGWNMKEQFQGGLCELEWPREFTRKYADWFFKTLPIEYDDVERVVFKIESGHCSHFGSLFQIESFVEISQKCWLGSLLIGVLLKMAQISQLTWHLVEAIWWEADRPGFWGFVHQNGVKKPPHYQGLNEKPLSIQEGKDEEEWRFSYFNVILGVGPEIWTQFCCTTCVQHAQPLYVLLPWRVTWPLASWPSKVKSTSNQIVLELWDGEWVMFDWSGLYS